MGMANENYEFSYTNFGANKRISYGFRVVVWLNGQISAKKIGSQAFKYTTDGR
jgi:hypothetical protein